MIGHFLTPFSRDHMTNCGKIHPSKKMRQASSNWLKVSLKVELIALCKVLSPRFYSWLKKNQHIGLIFTPSPFSFIARLYAQ